MVYATVPREHTRSNLNTYSESVNMDGLEQELRHVCNKFRMSWKR